ncbi:thiamine pyrophosphate-binding protein [Desertibaculum subflavum]|uniref:thiamine pyrophosphate-binding protein n=1 Tax=Desertibaculum subflavum TaxID=2268458 RepID=UPI000E667EC2
MTSNRITGRSAFLAVLKDEGVTHMFGNPGTTELPIMHALAEHPELTYVLGLQESLVVAMADGFARATGRLAACNVHVAPGLGNAMGALYTAWNTGSPLIVTAGQQEQGHGLTEPLLYGPLVPMAQPCVKWAVEVTRLEDLPRILRRAAKIALTPPTGPVFISLPGDVLNRDAAIELGRATRVDTRVRPSDALLRQLASTIAEAKRPVILAGHELATGDALKEAAEFAEALGAPVYQQSVMQGSHFPSEHPAYMGGTTRQQKDVRAILEPYDMIVSLGTDFMRMSVYSEVDPMPDGMRVVQIGQRDWELGKNYPAELAVRADLKETLPALSALIRERVEPAKAKAQIAALSATNWTAKRMALADKAAARRGLTPLDPDWLMLKLCELLPLDCVVVDEGIITARSLNAFYPYRDKDNYFGNVSGGIGWALPAAIGVALGLPKRRVVAVIGDGSSMYSIQALWTAAHLKLPITYVIADNGGYRIIKERLRAFHGSSHFIGMDFKDPAIDFVQVAKGFGMVADRVETADEFETAFRAALQTPGPVLLSVSVEKGL